jgi:hypothetical protein
MAIRYMNESAYSATIEEIWGPVGWDTVKAYARRHDISWWDADIILNGTPTT